MGPVGGAEILVILLVALIFLGPQKLPEIARQLGRAVAELRRISAGFQREMRNAMGDTSEEDARRRGQALANQRPIDPLSRGEPPRPAATEGSRSLGQEPSGEVPPATTSGGDHGGATAP